MIANIYRGSAKDLFGPVHVQQKQAVVFDFSDAYSVFDWGKMPDLLTHKGEALAILTADVFEKLERPETWKEFSRSPEALSLRKSNRFGGVFNEIGEELQAVGLRTHLLGALETFNAGATGSPEVFPKKVSDIRGPFRHLVMTPVSVVRPNMTTVLGRMLPDYYPTRTSPLPRLVPLEVVFRMGCVEGSSLVERAAQDPTYLASLGFPHLTAKNGQRWDFPVLELFTKLESTDRPVLLAEALAISGLSAGQLQEALLKTAWVAALLKSLFSKRGFELIDGKLEWALGPDGKCFLVDAIGPDELRIMKNGVQISKEFLRTYYRRTRWYQLIEGAKLQAKTMGTTEWKKLTQEVPPTLPVQYRDLAIQSYLALTNELTGRQWFPDAWPLDQVVARLKEVR